MGSKPTIYDVAALAGVSIATVSRVMGGGSVSAKSRAKVEDAMRALEYVPSSAHSHSQPRTNGVLGVVVGDLDNPYCAALCRGAEEEALRHGYALELYCHDGTRISSEQMVGRLLAHKPAGVVITGGIVEEGTHEQRLENLSRLSREMRVATIGHEVEGLPCINIRTDIYASVSLSMMHLVNMGHRRITFIGGEESFRFSSARIQAYHRAMESIGVPPGEHLVYPTGFTPRSGEMGVARMLAGLEPGRLPTAIVAVNDVCALGVLRQLDKAGIRVPQDMALVGCDNLFFSAYLNPPLTTVDLHAAERGRIAVAELVNALAGGETALFDHQIDCALIVRESCGAPLHAQRLREQAETPV